MVTSTATIMSLAASFDESVSCIPWCHFIQSKHSSWETSDVTDMSHLFHVATSSTQDISHWNTCSATAMWLICFIWSMVALPSMSAVSCGCIRCIKNVSRVPKLDFSNLRQFHPWIHPTWQVGMKRSVMALQIWTKGPCYAPWIFFDKYCRHVVFDSIFISECWWFARP